MLNVGETIGQYEIIARLKAGGMATLFVGRRAGAAGFSRHVAIKVVHEHLVTDQTFVKMFVDEALLQARIHHPNVVHVEELGEHKNQHFLVMEYVHGCSLAQLLDSLARRNRRLSIDLATHIAIQTLAGLHAAHELKESDGKSLGVVHRDVSPQNVLLAYEGHVKLIDFGVAKARNRSQQTTGASLKGKLRYMPPEQAFGRAIDRTADLYALGIVLWEMLAFRKLFSAPDDLALLDLVRQPNIKPPSTYAPEVPPALDAVVMKALALKPADRYQTANEFRRALMEALPKAAMVDASNLADLLVAAMDEQIQKDRELLPSGLSAIVAQDQRRAVVQQEEALHTMTVSAAGLDYLREFDVPIEEEAPVAAPVPAPPAQVVTVIQPEAVGQRAVATARNLESPVAAGFAMPTESPTATPLPTPIQQLPAEPRSGSRLSFVIGAVVAVILAVGAGAYAYLRRSTPAEIVATPLATPPAVPTPVLAGTAAPTPTTSASLTPVVAAEVPVALPPATEPPTTEPPTTEPPTTQAPTSEPPPAAATPAAATPAATTEPAGTGQPATGTRPRIRRPRPTGVPISDEW